ncbi:MAG TPA: restriction endonuclease [Candidatus Dormibacteraeota bacterium]|jgi:restriction system protein|nr:restriction endonuclease [Candidatus Dormibacteraeota bacterium]
MDIVFHYPPELTQLLVQTIPLLCPSKSDVLLFFKGAGVPQSVTRDLTERLAKDRNSINKYEIVRSVIERLNTKGEVTLRERREILKRVTEFDDFSTCWPADQLKAKGLVGEISRVVGVKDSFTRMKQAQEEERAQRVAERGKKQKEEQDRRASLASLRTELAALFAETDAHKRGKALEGILNRLFKIGGISVREAFVLRVDGVGVVEQVDGVIELDGNLYLVEVKWWKDALGPGDVAQHLIRVFNRGHARGVFISASGYTAAAVLSCKESLTRAVFVLCALEEIVLLLEDERDLKDFLKQKINAAILDKNPYHQPLRTT